MIKSIMNFIYDFGLIIFGVFMIFGFIFSIIGALVYKKRYGHLPRGQGYGKD